MGELSNLEKRTTILETFEKIIPQLSETGQERLLGFGEGLEFMINLKNKEPA